MLFQMLWVRGIVFTVLVPGVVGFFIPSAVDPRAQLRGGIANAGWLLVAAGMLMRDLQNKPSQQAGASS